MGRPRIDTAMSVTLVRHPFDPVECTAAMPASLEGKLVVAISSRALFDFEKENEVFEREGEEKYTGLQLASLDENSGVRVIARALEEPLRRILINAAEAPDVVLHQVLDALGLVLWHSRTHTCVYAHV